MAMIKLSEIKPNPKNPRKITYQQADRLIKSIEQLPQMMTLRPIVVDEDNVILGGRMRYYVLKKAGYKEIPEEWVKKTSELTEEQKREFMIKDNASFGEWDWDALANEWDDLPLADWGLDLPEDWLGVEKQEIVEDEPQIDRAEELRAEWGVELGQLWRLGEHRLLCGDSSIAADIMAVMRGEKAHLVFTDPPYGVSIAKKNVMLNTFNAKQHARKPLLPRFTDIIDDDLKPEDLKQRLLPAFVNIRTHVMAEDCTVFVAAPQGGELGMMMMMMQEAGLRVRHVLIWKKNSPTFSMGRLDYDYQHEPILLTWGKKHKRPMKGRHSTSVWEIDKPRASELHPTMKPVELIVNALLNNSDVGDISFDAYSGSGTSIIAAESTSRKCRAVEISPAYVAVALQRWADFTGKKPELMS